MNSLTVPDDLTSANLKLKIPYSLDSIYCQSTVVDSSASCHDSLSAVSNTLNPTLITTVCPSAYPSNAPKSPCPLSTVSTKESTACQLPQNGSLMYHVLPSTRVVPDLSVFSDAVVSPRFVQYTADTNSRDPEPSAAVDEQDTDAESSQHVEAPVERACPRSSDPYYWAWPVSAMSDNADVSPRMQTPSISSTSARSVADEDGQDHSRDAFERCMQSLAPVKTKPLSVPLPVRRRPVPKAPVKKPGEQYTISVSMVSSPAKSSYQNTCHSSIHASTSMLNTNSTFTGGASRSSTATQRRHRSTSAKATSRQISSMLHMSMPKNSTPHADEIVMAANMTFQSRKVVSRHPKPAAQAPYKSAVLPRAADSRKPNTPLHKQRRRQGGCFCF